VAKVQLICIDGRSNIEEESCILSRNSTDITVLAYHMYLISTYLLLGSDRCTYYIFMEKYLETIITLM